MLTIRTTAKRYPAWQFVAAGLLGIVVFALDGWAAHRLLGWDIRLARQAVILCWAVCLIFVPLLYRAYEIRSRDRKARAVPMVAVAFAAALFLVVLYYFDRTVMLGGDPVVRWLTIATCLIAFAGGALFGLYGVNYELD